MIDHKPLGLLRCRLAAQVGVAQQVVGFAATQDDMISASMTRWATMDELIDQPTTRRE